MPIANTCLVQVHNIYVTADRTAPSGVLGGDNSRYNIFFLTSFAIYPLFINTTIFLSVSNALIIDTLIFIFSQIKQDEECEIKRTQRSGTACGTTCSWGGKRQIQRPRACWQGFVWLCVQSKQREKDASCYQGNGAGRRRTSDRPA